MSIKKDLKGSTAQAPATIDRRAALAKTILSNFTPGTRSLQGDLIVAVGLTRSHWTLHDRPAAVVVKNPTDRELVPVVHLFSGAKGLDAPMTASIDDGEHLESHIFDSPGGKEVKLAPVAPHSERLFIVSTSGSWQTSGRDPRRFGVRVDQAEIR